MSISIQQRQEHLDEFLKTWPVERLQSMTLNEYSTVGDKNSLVYWLEFGAGRYLGSIKGGDSSKFGIYERKADPKGQREFISSDSRHSWKNKYGNSAEQAFSVIKKNINAVIYAVQSGDIQPIEDLDFESALKWKLAFIYQDHTKPLVLPIYKLSKFEHFMAGPPKFTHVDAYTKLLTQRGTKSALEFGFELWQQADAFEGKQSSDFDSEDFDEVDYENRPSALLNQILFGPPGTGKTYNVIDKALAILAPELLQQAGIDRAALHTKFTEFEKAGQIAFVTFHQSFSYEDFVEGLRAETSETGELNYRVVDGVFLTMCKRALSGRVAKDDPFDQALAKLEQQIEQSEDGLLAMQTIRGNKFNVSYTGGDTFLCYPASNPDLKNGYTANLKLVREFYKSGKTTSYNPPYVKGMLQYLKKNCGLPEQYQPPLDDQRKPFVLIIDEINRGNISRIFGELITLLEASKREGAPEALSVTLPYSRSSFAVPDNLYIIGTMNTADRSLASLDLALRRRFTFIEMPPRPELLDKVTVEGVKIGALLRVMNQRISVLLDRDHCIGHAYFITLLENNGLPVLREIFKQKIIPLLQEYFFEDWQRIRWVLNDQNKADSAAFVVEDPSLSIDTLFRGIDSSLPNRTVWQLNESAFDNISAYQGIL